ncbi:hypothetical protein SLE2022_343760 [Rubroshorea leprosula]
MASRFITFSTILIIIFLFALIVHVPSSEARKIKVLSMERIRGVSFLKDGLVQCDLPKGTTPPSGPSHSGRHAMATGERIDRILGSVPSPGVGH